MAPSVPTVPGATGEKPHGPQAARITQGVGGPSGRPFFSENEAKA